MIFQDSGLPYFVIKVLLLAVLIGFPVAREKSIIMGTSDASPVPCLVN